MRENRSAVSFDDVFGELGDTAERCIEAVCRDYDLSPAQARVLFEHVWIYTFGVGAAGAGRGALGAAGAVALRGPVVGRRYRLRCRRGTALFRR